MIQMLYGQGIPPELLAESAADRPSVDELDEEEQLKEAISHINIRVRSLTFCPFNRVINYIPFFRNAWCPPCTA